MSLHLFLHPVVPDLRPLQEPYSDWFPVAQWSGHDLYMIVLLVLLMTAAFMVSVTAAGASFTHGLSPLPAIVYLTLCFLVPDAFIHPVSVITVTGFLRLYQLIFNSYNKQQADSLLLNAGIWCGILSLLGACLYSYYLYLWSLDFLLSGPLHSANHWSYFQEHWSCTSLQLQLCYYSENQTGIWPPGRTGIYPDKMAGHTG